MKINKNDPRLTAYLLNEVSSEDRILIEQASRESSEIKEELEKLKKSLGLLNKETSSNPDFFKLTTEQRQQIFAKISDSQPNLLQRFMRGPWGYATAGLVTASFALMVFNHSLKDQVSQKADNSSPALAPTEIAVQDKTSEVKKKETFADEAAPAALGAPAPQMAAAESQKSVSSGAAFGESEVADGTRKGNTQNFQKMQKQSFANSESSIQARAGFAGPSSEFLLQTEPALTQNLREKLHTNFQDCLFNPDNSFTSFKLKWDGANISEVEPSTALSSPQKSCIEAQLKNTLGAKKDILLIKVNSISK